MRLNVASGSSPVRTRFGRVVVTASDEEIVGRIPFARRRAGRRVFINVIPKKLVENTYELAGIEYVSPHTACLLDLTVWVHMAVFVLSSLLLRDCR